MEKQTGTNKNQVQQDKDFKTYTRINHNIIQQPKRGQETIPRQYSNLLEGEIEGHAEGTWRGQKDEDNRKRHLENKRYR